MILSQFHPLLYINKIQRDATVCRCLFTAKLLYIFRVSIAPIIRSKSNCKCSFWYRSYHVSEQQPSARVAYLHTVASRWILLIQSYDARKHEYKIHPLLIFTVYLPVISRTFRILSLSLSWTTAKKYIGQCLLFPLYNTPITRPS